MNKKLYEQEIIKKNKTIKTTGLIELSCIYRRVFRDQERLAVTHSPEINNQLNLVEKCNNNNNNNNNNNDYNNNDLIVGGIYTKYGDRR